VKFRILVTDVPLTESLFSWFMDSSFEERHELREPNRDLLDRGSGKSLLSHV
jgi:hypothetical protein